MHSVSEKLVIVKNKVNEIIVEKQLKTKPQIIVVSKTFPIDNIIPLLNLGHFHFGENKIQEAESKWLEIKDKYKKLQLHMVGKLQSNKAKKAVKLFDYIHSLDNDRLANKIFESQKDLKKVVKLFIQVNLADEKQKSGIGLKDFNKFYEYCTKDLSLNIIGLMCIPPIDSNSNEYFKLLKSTSDKYNLNELSMGMSSDYESALSNGSTFLRLGTVIMGKRDII